MGMAQRPAAPAMEAYEASSHDAHLFVLSHLLLLLAKRAPRRCEETASCASEERARVLAHCTATGYVFLLTSSVTTMSSTDGAAVEQDDARGEEREKGALSQQLDEGGRAARSRSSIAVSSRGLYGSARVCGSELL